MLDLQTLEQGPLARAEATEAELIARAAQGDARAFEQIMRRHNQLLFRTARSILKNDADAEEALQDGYMRAWSALGDFRAEARLSTWLVRIVVNEALGRLRRKKLNVIPLDTAMNSYDPETQAAFVANPNRNPEREAMRTELRATLEQSIDTLPDAFRTVFMLRGVQGMGVGEVAEVLGIPDTTVRTRYFRARDLLRKSLGSSEEQSLEQAFAFDGARCDRIVEGVLARIHTRDALR